VVAEDGRHVVELGVDAEGRNQFELK
jgi:hypothetical protein